MNGESSPLEATLALQIRALKLPPPVREHKFLADRKFKFDFAWPDRMLACECDGEVHRIKGRFDRDMEKNALALLAGWRVLHLGGSAIRSGQGIQWLETLLKNDNHPAQLPAPGAAPHKDAISG